MHHTRYLLYKKWRGHLDLSTILFVYVKRASYYIISLTSP